MKKKKVFLYVLFWCAFIRVVDMKNCAAFHYIFIHTRTHTHTQKKKPKGYDDKLFGCECIYNRSVSVGVS